MREVLSYDSSALQNKMVLFINLIEKGLTQENNGDGRSIRWAPAFVNYNMTYLYAY